MPSRFQYCFVHIHRDANDYACRNTHGNTDRNSDGYTDRD
jgi:hypothetical protein